MVGQRPSGIIPALTTLTDESGLLDPEGLRSLVRSDLESKVHALGVSIVAGEFYKFSDEERKRTYEIVVDEVNGRIPVWAGVSHLSTEPAVQLARFAKDVGADGVIAMPPLVGREAVLTTDRHFSTILEKVDLPVIIQDAEDFSTMSIPATLVARLARTFNNLVCVKVEGPATLQKIRDLKELLGDRLAILGGMGGRLLLEEMELGSDGNIPSSCFSGLLVKAYERYKLGDNEGSRRIFSVYRPWLNFMTLHIMSAPEIQKETLRIQGIVKSSNTREPRLPLSEEAKVELESICKKILQSTERLS